MTHGVAVISNTIERLKLTELSQECGIRINVDSRIVFVVIYCCKPWPTFNPILVLNKLVGRMWRFPLA